MEKSKLDLYSGYTKEGLPMLSSQLTFKHPTKMIDKGTHTIIVEGTCNYKIVAIFRGSESIIFNETINEKNGKV